MNIEQKAINTLRVLSIEEITYAKSGHPGIALGAAPMIHAIYKYGMNIDPLHPSWINRDRFVLAAGHASSLLYATLHVAGFNVTKTDLEGFRQLGSITPGHPEVGMTEGVDASSGPLGQGIPEAVGMAIAERHLNAKYDAINHYTFCLCSDAELQEGIANEALSLAGTLALNKLIVFMDSNDIQLDGKVSDAYTEDTRKKIEAFNWNYILVKDGNNVDSLRKAILKAKKSLKPTFIEVKTIIGYGAEKQGTNAVHGNPLSVEEVEKFRNELGGEKYTVDSDVLDFYSSIKKEGEASFNKWNELYPNFELKVEPVDFSKLSKEIDGKATRTVVGEALKLLGDGYMAGSADLEASVKVKGFKGSFNKDNYAGNSIKFGVREHAMAAIANGIALHGGLVPVVGGFFVFSDYAKPAIRLSALQDLHVVYAFSHDSVAVGEDGPTHEPIEQVTGLRAIPNLNVIRPCNRNEVVDAMDVAINGHGPSFILATRQDLAPLDIESGLKKGAYIISDVDKPDGILIASGSEVYLALDAQKKLAEEGINVRVVSMPCTNLFDKEDSKYQEEVLPRSIRKRLAIEMSDAAHMYKYVGLDGKVMNITEFGKSGKAKEVIASFGFTVDNVVLAYKELK